MPRALAPTPKLRNSPAYLAPNAGQENENKKQIAKSDRFIIICRIIYAKSATYQAEIDLREQTKSKGSSKVRMCFWVTQDYGRDSASLPSFFKPRPVRPGRKILDYGRKFIKFEVRDSLSPHLGPGEDLGLSDVSSRKSTWPGNWMPGLCLLIRGVIEEAGLFAFPSPGEATSRIGLMLS
jgi:hypothetical protein